MCRQSDFSSSAPAVTEGSQTLHLFIPYHEPQFLNGHYQELLVPNLHYLLFLVELDEKQKAALTETYELDPNQSYYRGEERIRGVVMLPSSVAQEGVPKQSEVLEKTAKLCEVMRPANPADKLAGLEQLERSGDPVLQKEAATAKDFVKSSMLPAERGQPSPDKSRP